MQPIAPLMVLFSVLFPMKTWFAPDQPITIQIKQDATLVLLDFAGKPIETEQDTKVKADQTVDIKGLWRAVSQPGTFVLLAVPAGKSAAEFLGTPLVIDIRSDARRDAPPGPQVIKVSPLCYAVCSTDKGDMTMVFYYDVAPNTAANFLHLAAGGYFDGLTFHRIVPDFVIQGGDPRGDGTGGPGYHIDAEFNDRKHEEGVLSMARQGDPIERQGQMPRPEFSNSAGSQFFICLDYKNTQQLDNRYTAFGKVVDGLDVVRTIGKTPTDEKSQKPLQPQIIKSVRVFAVTADKNPYLSILNLSPVPTTPPETP